VTLYGDAPERTPTLMFNVDGRTSAGPRPGRGEQSRCGKGNYYAWELERFLGLAPDGAVRAGFVRHNDAEDADRLVAGVAARSVLGALRWLSTNSSAATKITSSAVIVSLEDAAWSTVNVLPTRPS
jgi:hypothetical protein